MPAPERKRRRKLIERARSAQQRASRRSPKTIARMLDQAIQGTPVRVAADDHDTLRRLQALAQRLGYRLVVTRAGRGRTVFVRINRGRRGRMST